MPARMAASLIGIGLLLPGVRAQEQTPPVRVLHFTKPPSMPAKAAHDEAIRPVLLQNQLPQASTRVPEEGQEYQVQLEPPGPLRLFRLESEKAWQERMRQEVRERTPPGATPERIVFPDEPVISREPYAGRAFPTGTLSVEPIYVCYDRLYFEQKNAERYGWDLGPIHPLVSAAGFYWDLITLPYHLGTEPCRRYECSTGYCLPGSPMPLLLYPPELSLTGLALEAGTLTALFAIFP
jgi:hypothetical protein